MNNKNNAAMLTSWPPEPIEISVVIYATEDFPVTAQES